MALNFPPTPAPGELTSQPNGLIYQWDDVKQYWISLGSLNKGTSLVAVGSVHLFPRAPEGDDWLRCDGQAVSRVTYANLFAFLGSAYGDGDGATTFNLPDYRGRIVRDTDAGAGRDPDAGARADRGDGVTGDVVGTTQDHSLKSHLEPDVHPGTSLVAGNNHRHSGGGARDNNADGPTLGNTSRAQARTNVNYSDGAHTHPLTDPGHQHGPQGGVESIANNIQLAQYIYTGASI